MIEIKTLNAIDDIIFDHLDADTFTVSSEAKAPQGILVRSADMHKDPLPEGLLAIARAGAGTNNIPIDACSEQGIVVFNTPGANANAVKELVIAGLLLSGRNIIEAVNWVNSLKGQEGIAALVEKNKNQFAGRELLGRTFGVIGLGAIGAMVANSAYYGLNMDVVGCDPFISVQSAWGLSRHIKRAMSQDELLGKCDYISLHVPMIAENRGMIGEREFAMMRPGVVLLNFSRGEVVDDQALLAALKSGQVGCYITDFPNEALVGVENVLAIPHLGASTYESESNCAAMAAEELKEYLLDGNIRNSVNFPACAMPRSTQYRITVLHENKTNMVGQLTAALAAEHVNIANMINKSSKALAYTIFDLDNAPTEACVAHMGEIDGILKVRSL